MTTAYETLNSLPELSFIGGTKKVLTFNCYESDGVNPVLIQTGTVIWRLCPYGEFGVTTLEKTGVLLDPEGGASPPYDIIWRFRVTLTTADTVNLSGKYIQQAVISDFFGDEYIPGQGSVIIFPSIAVA